MPEADRFERRLPQHWRKPYRVAKSGNDLGIVVDCLMPAFRETLEKDVKPEAFMYARELLLTLLNDENGEQQAFGEWTRAILQKLNEMEDSHDGELCTPLIVKAAKRVHGQLSTDGAPVSIEQVQDALAVAFGNDLLRQQFSAKVRAGLMEARGRDFDQEERWERDLESVFTTQVCAFFRTLFKTERIPLRSPSRLTKPLVLTRETLEAPLDLSGTAHE
jgi:hypothetical protein